LIVSQPLFETLYERQVQLVTKLKTNMRNRLVPIFDKIMLRKRAIIESVMDQLKNVLQEAKHSQRRQQRQHELFSEPEALAPARRRPYKLCPLCDLTHP
jgi:Transposase DDE domain